MEAFSWCRWHKRCRLYPRCYKLLKLMCNFPQDNLYSLIWPYSWAFRLAFSTLPALHYWTWFCYHHPDPIFCCPPSVNQSATALHALNLGAFLHSCNSLLPPHLAQLSKSPPASPLPPVSILGGGLIFTSTNYDEALKQSRLNKITSVKVTRLFHRLSPL